MENNIVYTEGLREGIVIREIVVAGTQKRFTKMEENLIEVAKRKLEELEENHDLYESDWSKAELDNVQARYNQLKNMMPTQNLKDQALKFNTAAFDYCSSFGESQFLQGYLEGFKYAKQMNQEPVDLLEIISKLVKQEIQKERTAATVRS